MGHLRLQGQVHDLEGFQRPGPAQRLDVDGFSAPELARSAMVFVGSASSPVMNTSSGWPFTWPATRVSAKVVLNALTTRARGASAATCSAADVPGSVVGSNVEKSAGLAMSTTIFPARKAVYNPSWLTIIGSQRRPDLLLQVGLATKLRTNLGPAGAQNGWSRPGRSDGAWF